MHKNTVLAFLVLQCTLCLAIRVPVDWKDDSEVKDEQSVTNEDNEQSPQPSIYNDYFKYTANKPQFAVDSAIAYGFQSPESHYKSHPVRPHTGLTKPVLGQYQILNSEKDTYKPYQQFVQNSVESSYVTPVSTSFEVYHPYKVEQPALQEIYKDPVLDKIRNDLRDTKNRLHNYEKENGGADISKDEYLESPAKTDRKKFPYKSEPAPYEVHRPQRRPIYYRPPVRSNYREQVLNHKLKHPWNQRVKVTPYHYRPVKNHLHSLRQHHALKYDDERNQYPQLPLPEKYGEVPDGYDIYEKGKANYVKFRNNADETLNKALQENRPYDSYKLELQNGYSNDDSTYGHDKEEFVPIKNYAQVRKTEITKHLPRTAALRDAETFEELQNAPRLREAIKSTKAQVVYSEEGYEDAAYDHAGEHKHASDHEGHGGYLKENEISGGKYQTPSVSTSYDEAKGSEYRDQLIDGKKWKDYKKEDEDEIESDDYSEDDDEHDLSDVIVDELNLDNDSDRNKRNSDTSEDAESSDSVSDKTEKNNSDDANEEKEDVSQHEVIKRETSFKLPEFDFNSTLPSKAEILKLSKAKVEPLKLVVEDNNNDEKKYPYYFQNIKTLNKNSPLRYAENVVFIPKKSSGGTEFYDSRSNLECSEIEENLDAVPDKLKKEGHPDENDESSDNNTHRKKTDEKKFDTLKNKQRLKGLGDKIDCFKAKYFGENPLDSPFFKEDIIHNPEPISKPNLKVFKPKKLAENIKDKLHYYDADIFSVLDKIHNLNNSFNSPVKNESSAIDSVSANSTDLKSQSSLFTNIANVTNNRLQEKIKSLENAFKESNIRLENLSSNLTSGVSNPTYKHFKNKELVTKPPQTIRKKRAAPFTYEPYKIIRDSQIQDSKKTTTTGNISPLIKQLQSSKIIDKVNSNLDKEQNIKNNAKLYKDIGKLDRNKGNEQINDSSNATFVDVNSDKRRGEPRFELRPANHKDTYTPVENKRAMSLEEYKTQNSNKTDNNSMKQIQTTTQSYPKRTRATRTTSRPFFDVSKYLPQTIESQSIAASNAVKKVIRTPQVSNEKKIGPKLEEKVDKDDDDEEYEEYEDDDEDNEEEVDETTTTTTTTTSTRRPSTRKRTRGTTTIKTTTVENETEPPKLRLTTRFRNPSTTTRTKSHHEVIRDPVPKVYIETDSPKYTEKKKKSSKSMLVTDTKTYGDDDDDVTRKEVDALLRVKQDMNEYMPRYEKENNKHSSTTNHDKADETVDSNDDDEVDEADNEDDEDEDDDDDDYEDDEDEFDDEEDDDENENSDDSKNKNDYHNLETTTSEPTKRTLAKTTVAPATTTESRSARIELKPVIVKKKFEVHEETPVNKSSPHVTQFKQDIKEIEIIKEMAPKAKKKIHKNLEALDLYRDENLAEEINKLGDVEVFKENLNRKEGPKHGGNYRSITPEDLQKEIAISKQREVKVKGDVEPSPTQPRKRIQLDSQVASKRQNPSSSSRLNNNSKNAKLIELSESEEVSPNKMHGGNLKYARNKGERQSEKNEKFIELDESVEDDTSKMHGGNFKSHAENRNAGRQMHGGNYKNAKIVKPEETTTKPRGRTKNRDARTNAAVLLNSYARVVPILTTTPPYILDPSKRMYYYVDA